MHKAALDCKKRETQAHLFLKIYKKNKKFSNTIVINSKLCYNFQ